MSRLNRIERPPVWAPTALPPLLDDTVADFVYGSPEALLDLVRAHGSPLHLVWPERLKKNVGALRTVMEDRGISHRIFYGAKVNKSPALVRAAVEAGAGVDVSSVYELRDALRAGAAPDQICASGPAKTRAFHAELIDRGAFVAIDSPEELQDLEVWLSAECPEKRARILLRHKPMNEGASRFGMPPEAVRRCLQRLAGQPARFDFAGFHFHLGGYAHQDRVAALFELADLIDEARRLSLAPSIVDIGGGLPVRYVDSAAYESFLHAQSGEHYRNGRVPAAFYPYGGGTDASTWLAQLLDAPWRDGGCVADFFRHNALTLALEPGRCLADQTALSVFRITRVKPLETGHGVIFVEGSSFSACETWFGSEFLLDPVLVSDGGTCPAEAPCRAYIAGHSCLDEDVLTNRLIAFSATPRSGDLLIYANTGGYQMDLLENEFHRHPMPRRLALVREASGALCVTPDNREDDQR